MSFPISAPHCHQQGATVLLLSHLLPLLELHINGAIPNALFYVEFLLVIIMSMRFIHIVAPAGRFLFRRCVVFYLYACTAVYPSSVDKHLGCFHFWTLQITVAVHIFVHVNLYFHCK